MRIKVQTEPNGQITVRNAATGELVQGVWRVELVATGTSSGRPELALYVDPEAIEIDVDGADVRLRKHDRPAYLSGQGRG